MTTHAVDASVFGPFFFEDEREEQFSDLPRLISEDICIVPQHWRLEVTNQILSGLRRNRTTEALAAKALLQIEQFSIATDDGTDRHMADTFDLARTHGLTIYDAAYLELAIRRNLTLVTYDIELRRAATTVNIDVLPP
jgi:predicted nucleic acid-binding protein